MEYCQRRGWDGITEFADVISGSKVSRVGLDAMMEGVRAHRFDAILVVKLDRLGRSLAHLSQVLHELTSHRVALISTSQGIDTLASADNPAAVLQLHVLMAVAQFERSIIRERTKAGLAAAVAKGKVLGRRKRIWTDKECEVIAEWTGTVKGLARRLGCSVGTAHKVLSQVEEVEE